MKRTIYFITAILIFILLTFGITFSKLYHPVTYKAPEYTEKAQLLSNPYCGFYRMYGYVLKDEGTEDVLDWCEGMQKDNDCNLYLLEINLCRYQSQPLSDQALAQLDCMLDSFSRDNHKLILRFIYDWDADALQAEPSSRSIIEQHMSQIAASVNAHKDSILTLQGLFTGNFGEMNNTNYSSEEDLTALATKLAEVIHPDIYLAVRTPAQLRSITKTMDTVTEETAYQSTLFSRLGLFNDGMLGSETDCGTYGLASWSEDALYSHAGNREDEINFQNRLCQYVPNGGEAVLDNSYNDLENAIEDLSRMHVSYLNFAHDPAVMEKWKNSVYSEDDIFSGWSGFDYIAAHLGYRYLITESQMDFDTFRDRTATLSVTITNTGFAPSYRKYDCTLSIQNTATGEQFSVELPWDNRLLSNGEQETLSAFIPVRDMESGNYRLSLVMKESSTGQVIHFANEESNSQPEISLGSFTLQ